MRCGIFALRRDWMVGLACAGCLAIAAPLGAADPLDDLRQALSIDDDNPTETMLQFRRDNLQKKIDALQTIGQLRRALALDDWRDDPSRAGDEKIRDIDAKKRSNVGKRLTDLLERHAKTGAVEQRLAIANMIAEMGPTVRALSAADKGGFTRSLFPLVATLTKDSDRGVRQEALRALGNLNGNAKDVAQLFAGALKNDPQIGPRRVAADGLGQMIRVVKYLDKPTSTREPIAATRAEVLEVLQETIQASPVGFRDPDALVRVYCAAAFEAAVEALADSKLIANAYAPNKLPPADRPLAKHEQIEIDLKHKELQSEAQQLRSVLTAIRARLDELLPLLGDADPRVRLAAVEALVEVATVRQRFCLRMLSLPHLPAPARVALLEPEPLQNSLAKCLSALGPLWADSDVQLRKAATTFLMLSATPVLDPELVTPLVKRASAQLTDPDGTVRMIAARALASLVLEKIDPAVVRELVPNLTRLLSEADISVRVAAADTLKTLGPLAGAAAGDLVQAAMQGDAESRIAAMQALSALGPAATERVVPRLTELLDQRDADVKVLASAAETLGQYGGAAKGAVPTLRRLIGHDSSEVRIAASEAILAINGTGQK